MTPLERQFAESAALFVAGLPVALTCARRLKSGRSLGVAVWGILAATLLPIPGPKPHPFVVPFDDVAHILRAQAWGVTKFIFLAGNVALFVPFGVIAAARARRAALVVGAGFALSVAVELIQTFVPGRTPSVDDVILNVTGAALGVAVSLLLRARAPAGS